MTHRILLADDSLTIRKVVELTFSDEDFTIDSVGDGALAFEHARAQRPDIIISDVIMPGLNGYELCRQVKADPALQSVPFLFLKGTFESFDEEKANSCGSDGFIVKPFESQEMIAKVRKMIERAALAPAVAPVQPPRSVAAPAAPLRVPPVAPPPLRATPIAPPPLPTIPARPASAPAAIPAMVARPTPPAPPIPPRPVRPIDIATPPAPTPLQATPPLHQPPPSRFAPPRTPAPAPSPAAAQHTGEDFGFDLGETDADRGGFPAEQPAVREHAAPSLLSTDESDEDLWSEVSLRGNANDLLEVRSPDGSGAGPGEDIVELAKETALDAPGVLFEDDEAFEETVAVAPEMPPAPAAPAPAVPVPDAPVTTGLSGPAAPISVDPAEIERIVASRVEAAVRKALEPIVGDLARSMIEAVAWEVIPDLAEAMIRAEIERVRQSTRTA